MIVPVKNYHLPNGNVVNKPHFKIKAAKLQDNLTGMKF